MKHTHLKNKIKAHLRVSLYRNAYYLMAGSAAAALLGFVFWIVVARYYSPSDVGLAGALISAMQMLATLSTLGFDIGLIRFLPEERDKQGVINSCLTIPGILSIVLAVIFISGLALWTPKLLFIQENLIYLLCFVIFTVINCLFSIQRSIFIAFRSANFNFIIRILASGIKIALPVILVFFGAFGIFSSMGIALCITVLIGILLIRKVLPGYRPLPMFRRQVINRISYFSFGNYIAGFINSAPIYILPLMVLSLLGAEINAYFYIAFNISQIVFMLPVATSMSLFAEGSNTPEEIRSNTMRAVKLTLTLMLPLIAIILLFGDKILLFFGKEYSESASNLLSILVLSGIPLVIIEPYIAIKRVQKQVKPIIYTWIFFAIVTLGASYLLTTKMGLIGAGIGWLLGTGLTAVITTTVLVRWLRKGASIT